MNQALSLLLALCAASNAFTPSRLPFRRRRNHQFFSVERILPPLHPIPTASSLGSGGSSNSTFTTLTLPYSPQPTSEPPLHFSDHGQDPLPALYTNDPKMVNQWLVENVPMDGCAIGFDTESVPDAPWISSKFKGHPVTVQLATTDASIVIPLIRNNRYSKACLPLIEAVLLDPSIIKCGCSIDDDMLDLKKKVPEWSHLEARSRLDLGLLGLSKNRIGLQALTRIFLQLKLEKPKRLAVSDWSQSPLTDDQVAYGARDAWAGAAVLEELERLDPDVFGVEPLMEFLDSQPSLDDLSRYQKVRKEAKKRIAKYQKTYRKGDVKMRNRMKCEILRLKSILKEMQLNFSVVESLAFIPEES